MRTIETKVFTFEELSESAKENARQWWRECENAYVTEFIYDDAAKMGALLGITFGSQTIPLTGGGKRQEPTIYYSGFSSQGDGACFEGSYQYAKGAAKAIKAETSAGSAEPSQGDKELLRIAVDLQKIQARNFYQLTANTKQRGHHSHSGCMLIDVERSDEKEMTDDAEEEITQLLRDFADWIYSQLEAAYDYVMSDEYVDESIKCNEHEFTSDGKII